MHYYFSTTYIFVDLNFIDFCNVMLVLCVYFRYLSVKCRRASKLWNKVKKGKKVKREKKVKKSASHTGSQTHGVRLNISSHFPEFQNQFFPLSSFSSLLETWSEAIQRRFLPINTPEVLSWRTPSFRETFSNLEIAYFHFYVF